jgi:hypothetical protein
VDIDILMRKWHPSTWKIIDNLHHDTRTCIKWKQQVSDSFDCQQGVKQGGLLSAELYIEDLLKSYENSKIGCRIGIMMAAFNGEMFVVKPCWSGDCFSVNIVRQLVLAMCSSSLHVIGNTTIPL